MNLVITGATGNVGRAIVPILAARGVRPLLVGRDLAALAAAFPGHDVATYDDLPARDLKGATLLHLAAVNNDSGADPGAFRAGNVDFLIATATAARDAGVARFVNLSTTHALDPGRDTPYARTKREGATALAAIPDLNAVTLHIPAFHGSRWSGRLAPLNRLPSPLARTAFQPLAALQPTVSARTLADALLDGLPEPDGDEPLILADDIGRNLFYRTATRALDLVAALFILVGLSWLLAALWLMIRRESPGPGLFAQTRVGRDGRPFTCLKFRTMLEGTPQVGTHDAPAAAVTGLGQRLRALKLDELPQAWNLLKGEMALIGPRPCLPVQTALIEERRKRGVLRIKPGISGLAQVNGIDMSDPVRLARWDARYGALRCLALDLKLILATARGGGRGDRVRS